LALFFIISHGSIRNGPFLQTIIFILNTSSTKIYQGKNAGRPIDHLQHLIDKTQKKDDAAIRLREQKENSIAHAQAYSVRRLSTGLAIAAPMALKLTVSRAIEIADKPANRNIHPLIGIR
jgi:hypothetical protein